MAICHFYCKIENWYIERGHSHRHVTMNLTPTFFLFFFKFPPTKITTFNQYMKMHSLSADPLGQVVWFSSAVGAEPARSPSSQPELSPWPALGTSLGHQLELQCWNYVILTFFFNKTTAMVHVFFYFYHTGMWDNFDHVDHHETRAVKARIIPPLQSSNLTFDTAASKINWEFSKHGQTCIIIQNQTTVNYYFEWWNTPEFKLYVWPWSLTIRPPRVIDKLCILQDTHVMGLEIRNIFGKKSKFQPWTLTLLPQSLQKSSSSHD